jgi:hypothetical protein
MGGELIFGLFGVLGKVGGYLFSNWLQSRESDKERLHEERLAALNKPKDTHFRGFDDAHSHTRWTRRALGLMGLGTYCFLASYALLNADTTFVVPVAQDLGFFGWLFGGTSETPVEVSLGYFALAFKDLAFMIAGFYFTPVGASTKQG